MSTISTAECALCNRLWAHCERATFAYLSMRSKRDIATFAFDRSAADELNAELDSAAQRKEAAFQGFREHQRSAHPTPLKANASANAFHI